MGRTYGTFESIFITILRISSPHSCGVQHPGLLLDRPTVVGLLYFFVASLREMDIKLAKNIKM